MKDDVQKNLDQIAAGVLAIVRFAVQQAVEQALPLPTKKRRKAPLGAIGKAMADIEDANTDIDDRLLRCIRQMPGKRMEEIEVILGRKPQSLKAAMARLLLAGLVKKSGAARGTTYAPRGKRAKKPLRKSA